MKNKYLLSILSILVLVIWFSIAEYQDIKNREKLYNMELNYYNEICNKDVEKCQILIKPTLYKMDAIGQMFYTIKNSHFNYMILFFSVFITIPGTYRFYKEYKNGYVKNILVRKSYNKYMKQIILDGIKKTIFIIPMWFCLCFLISYFLCDRIVDINYTFSHAMSGVSLPEIIYLKKPFFFSLTYLVNLVLLSLTSLNIGFLCVKKSKNFILSTIKGLLIYFLANIVFSIGLGSIILNMILNIEGASNYVSFYNLISYEAPINNPTIYGLLYMFLFMIITTVLSFVLIYISYHNKERMFVEIEN